MLYARLKYCEPINFCDRLIFATFRVEVNFTKIVHLQPGSYVQKGYKEGILWMLLIKCMLKCEIRVTLNKRSNVNLDVCYLLSYLDVLV